MRITNYQKLHEIQKDQLALVLSYFIDHMSVCREDGNNCVGCPIRQDGCCLWPAGDCKDSAKKWLNQYCNESAVWWSNRREIWD